MTAKIACKNCRFWDPALAMANANPGTTGLCRAKAPTFNEITGGACWPFTEDMDWCGQFQKAPRLTYEGTP